MTNRKNPLYGQRCAFTGKLQKYTRKEAMQVVSEIGGLCGSSVTKKTRFLILGTQLRAGKSNKQLKAEKNLANGQNIEVISERVFYKMLSSDGYSQICMDEWLLRCDSP